MTRQPDEIRSEIDEAREELADTAAALAYKTDLKARAKDRVTELKDKAPSSVQEAGSTARSNAVPIGAIAGLTLAFALGYLVAKKRS